MYIYNTVCEFVTALGWANNEVKNAAGKTAVTCKIKHLQNICKKCFSGLFYM